MKPVIDIFKRLKPSELYKQANELNLKNKIEMLLPLLLCVVTGYLFALQLLNYHAANITDCIRATMSPINGHAWWRAFQNRYLSAWIIEVIGSFQTFTSLGFIVINVVSYYLYNKNAWIVLAQMGALFLLQEQAHWLYGWDVLDILMILLVLVGVKNEKGLLYYTILFSVFIFNRESALYIPVFLLIKKNVDSNKAWANQYAPFGNYVSKLKYSDMYSLELLFIGEEIINILRSNFVVSCQHYIGMDLEHLGVENHFYFLQNITHPFYTYQPYPFVHVPFRSTFDIIPITLISLSFTLPRNAITILFWIIFSTVLVFGMIHETRGLMLTIPLFIYNFTLQTDKNYDRRTVDDNVFEPRQ